MMRYRRFWGGWMDKEFQALPRNGSARHEERQRRYEFAADSFVELSPVMAERAADWLDRSMGAFWPGDEQVRRKAQNICAFLNALPQPVRFPRRPRTGPMRIARTCCSALRTAAIAPRPTLTTLLTAGVPNAESDRMAASVHSIIRTR